LPIAEHELSGTCSTSLRRQARPRAIQQRRVCQHKPPAVVRETRHVGRRVLSGTSKARRPGARARLPAVAPRARPQIVKLSPDVERHLREAIEESEREGYADMSAEETDLYLETGELPARVKTWAASCDSRRAT
jgi:hypothetical protein